MKLSSDLLVGVHFANCRLYVNSVYETFLMCSGMNKTKVEEDHKAALSPSTKFKTYGAMEV